MPSYTPVPTPLGTAEDAIPVMIIPPAEDIDDEVDVPLDGFEETDQQVELLKASYEDKIIRLHESYR